MSISLVLKCMFIYLYLKTNSKNFLVFNKLPQMNFNTLNGLNNLI